MQAMSPHRSMGGFTLLEVLVGIAILGIAAVVLGAAYANTLGAHAAVAKRASAGSGIGYLQEAVLNEPEREKVEKGGQLALPDNRQLRWDATVEEATVPDLFKVTVRGEVYGGSSTDKETFEQRIMLLRPTWADQGKREQLRADWNKRREKLDRR